MVVSNSNSSPHAVLAALTDIERKSESECTGGTRAFARYSLRGEAILQTLEDATGEMRTLRVQLRDISLSGIGFLSSQPLVPGTVWRVTFVVGNLPLGQHALSIRNCRRIAADAHLAGGQFCLEPGILHVVGVNPAALSVEEDAFVKSNDFLSPGDVR